MALQKEYLGKSTPADYPLGKVEDEVADYGESAWLDGASFKITDWEFVNLKDDRTGKTYCRLVFHTTLGADLFWYTLTRIRKSYYGGILTLKGNVHDKARELVTKGLSWEKTGEAFVKEFKDVEIHVKRTDPVQLMSRATNDRPAAPYWWDYPQFSTDTHVWD